MPAFTFTDPGGKQYTVNGPDGSTPEQAFQVLQAQLGQAPAAPRRVPSVTPVAVDPSDNVRQLAGDQLKAGRDVALSLARGVVAAPVAGIAGLVSAPFVGMDRAADITNKIQGAIAGQPFSDVGKRSMALIAKPLTWAANKADQAGQAVSDATGSPALGTAVNTAIQGAPALLAPEVRGAIGSVMRGGAQSASTAATAVAAAAKAKAYAGSVGLDWNSLGDSVRAKITQIAAQGADLSNLDRAALAREAKFASLPVPVPATRGTLMRDAPTMRREANVAATSEGQPIADTNLAANQALLDNLDVLKGKVSGTGTTAAVATNQEGAGAAVQGAARGKLELAKAQTKALYQKAQDAGETKALVDVTPLDDLIRKTPDQSHYGYAKSWIDQNTDGPGTGISIDDLEDLRKAAVAKASNGGEDAYYASKLIGAIDTATDGAGGDLYKAARAARKAQGNEFEQQGAVADLVDNSSRTDRATALENTVKAVTGQTSSLEDIRNVKRTLLTGGDEDTRTAGRQAWREVRAQVIQKIKDDATKGVAPNADGSPNLQPGAFKRSIDALGPDKLNEIFGPGTANQLNQILSVAQDAKTIPSVGPAVGSSTMQNVLSFLSKGITKGVYKVPIIGDLAEAKVTGMEAKAATVTPLSEALATASKIPRQTANRNARIGAYKTSPLSSLYSQKGQ